MIKKIDKRHNGYASQFVGLGWTVDGVPRRGLPAATKFHGGVRTTAHAAQKAFFSSLTMDMSLSWILLMHEGGSV